ncbi:MAG TPA: nickel pincer cofactor biosynthesis protein LarC [Candidatus Eremiobacteraceae bacterium]|nr:nickel pincer cofactor biosynthesis protein LarC [Candidatus Eremiobacteraceae bacterium]
MRIARFDCFSGASGNMIMGALVDAGLSLDALERELRKLPVEGWSIEARRVDKRGLSALYLDVHVPGEDHDHEHHHEAHHDHQAHAHRKLADVLSIVRRAGFPAAVEKAASAIYHRLAEAEAHVHGSSIDEIAFHEVGQVDAIIDIAGAALGLYLLGIERVYCSSMPCGRGFIDASHGRMPSPAPATLELLRGAPTYDIDIDAELVTPTGAAILSTIASFEQRPPMIIDSIGYGAGRSEFPFPNALRVLVGETVESRGSLDSTPSSGDVTVLETNIDDMSPQLYEHAIDRIFAAGALDAWTHPVQMKKGRPGTQLCVIAPPERADAVASAMLAETTTIGVRRWNVVRDTLAREEHVVQTGFGPVHVKLVRAPSGPRARPEFDDCLAIAQRNGTTLAEIMRRVEADVDEWLASKHR